MELVERYVYAMGKNLPRRKRQDIMAELRSSLYDELDARSEEQPSDEQVFKLLQEYGPPEKVAASFYPQGQYLIGPELLPVFKFAVGLVLGILLGNQVIWGAISEISNGDVPNFKELFGDFFLAFTSAFSLVVLFFALLQQFGHKKGQEQEWDPKALPAIEDADKLNRRYILARSILDLVMVIALIFVPNLGGVVILPRPQVVYSSVMRDYALWIALLMSADLFLNLFLLYRERWNPAARLVRVGINVLSVYLIYLVISGHSLLLKQTSDMATATERGIIATSVALGVILIFHAVEALFMLYSTFALAGYKGSLGQAHPVACPGEISSGSRSGL